MAIEAKDQPDIRPYRESGDLYVVWEDWFTPDLKLVVPKGFKTDGASAPKWSLSLVGFQRDGIHRAAAVVHDWLYSNRGRVGFFPDGTFEYTRKKADEIFYQMLQEAKIKRWQAWLAFAAVRMFGRLYWNSK